MRNWEIRGRQSEPFDLRNVRLTHLRRVNCGQLILRGTCIVLQQATGSCPSSRRVVESKQNLRRDGVVVWWSAMEKAADMFGKSSYGCQLVARLDPPEPLRSTTLSEGPWQDLAVEVFGPLLYWHSIFVVIDYYSRYYECAILNRPPRLKVIDSLEEVFSCHGLPVTIKSDIGPQFHSQKFRDYCIDNGISHLKVTPRWTQANGEVYIETERCFDENNSYCSSRTTGLDKGIPEICGPVQRNWSCLNWQKQSRNDVQS